MRLPFRAAPGGNMFQKKIAELFSSILNVFSIADDILIACFDEWGIDCDEPLGKYSGYADRQTKSLTKIRAFSCVLAVLLW